MASSPLPIRFTPEARDDVRQARAWYEQRREGLGDEFRAEVRDRLDLVRGEPLAGERVDEGVRRVLLPRFPYAVLYEPRDKAIVVYGVLHTARGPGATSERLGG